MPSTQQNLTLWADRNIQINVPILDQNGLPYNVGSSGSATWSMSPAATSLPAVLQKSTPSGITLVNNSGTWSAIISIVPADTVNIAPATYYHELAVKDSAGNVVNVSIGTITLQPSLNLY